MSSDNNENLELEQKKIELEERKIKFEEDKLRLDKSIEQANLEQEKEIEQAKLKVEKSKARWTALSIFIPLITIAGTFVISQIAEANKAKADFKIKAAEIVMNRQMAVPFEVKLKAQVLSEMFPDVLPPGFAAGFKPDNYNYPVWSDSDARDVFLQIVAQKSNREELIRIWKELFPDDVWLNDIK
jgi:hypothetical protein